jgi:uncharacterized membrane protein
VLKAGADFPFWFKIFVLITFLVLLYLSICIMFAPYFIYYFKYKPMAACKESFAYIKNNWGWYFVLYLIFTISILIGFLMLGIGKLINVPQVGVIILGICLLITLPIVRLASYYVFSKRTGLDKFEE